MDIQIPIKNYENKYFCINCGKKGHISKKCLCPIISIGIICVKIKLDDFYLNSVIEYSKRLQSNYLFSIEEIMKLKKIKKKMDLIDINDYNNLIQYLMVRRRNSLNYIEFIRGKYDINNFDYLERTINFITIDERENILRCDFDILWKNLWKDNNIINNLEYQTSYEKFLLLKNGLMIKKNDIDIYFNLKSMIENTIYKFKEPEWGFPKGRRNFKEKNIECAKREFEEETNILNANYNIINMTPLEETYLASNGLKYKHIYYIGQIKDNQLELMIDDNNMFQNIEIGDIKWFTFEESMNIIRDYNIEKKNILLNLHMNIKYTLQNFKLLLDNFLKKVEYV